MSPGEFVRVRVQLQTPRGATWFDPDAVVTRVSRGSGKDTVGVRLVSPPTALADVLATRVCDHLAGRGRSRARSTPPKRDGDGFELAALFRSAVEDVER